MTKKIPFDWSQASPGTVSVWGGEETLDTRQGTQTPIVPSVTFAYENLEDWTEVARGQQAGHIYSRSSNPTVHVLEEKICLLEGAEAAASFATGMAAISDTLHTLLSPGDRVVTLTDSYGGTSKIFLEILPQWGVEVELCETSDHAALEAAISKGCRVDYLESPTNPTLKVLDLQRLALDGDSEAVRRFLPELRFAHLAASLGSVGTLAGPPSTTSHVELTGEQRAALGIPESLIRYSVGIENSEDLIADLDAALESL